MSEDIRPDVIKKTQETLGKFIKKPTLTEKLLKKPPFRFLHDICTSVTRETGFFEGVLNQGDQFENIKDKDGKILFLQKVIAAVEAAVGVKLGVKPNKVVAGLEATKTNEFLQALAKALEKQQLERKSSKTVLQAKIRSTKKTGKEVKEEPPDKKKSSGRSSKKIAENGQNEIGDNKTKTEAMTVESPKKIHSGKKTEHITSGEDLFKLEDESSIPKSSSNGCAEESREEVSRKNTVAGAGESKDVPDVGVIGVNGINGQEGQNQASKEEINHIGGSREFNKGKHNKHRRSSLHNALDQARETELSEANENLKATKGENGDVTSTTAFDLKNKSEFQTKITPSTSGLLNYSKKDTSLVREGTLISRPRTGIRLTTARPASARPAAPRIRDRSDVAVSEEDMKPASGRIQVIVDEDSVNEVDEEALISLETTSDLVPGEPQSISPVENVAEHEHEHRHGHGHLVEQILEVQRELENDAEFSQRKETGKTEFEWELGRIKESGNREIEKLRGSIQTLTRTANPLGKLLDFFQEDFETVQKELESWRNKNTSYRLQIEQEKIVTEQYVEPLKIHLKEIQKNIDEQLDQISVVKASIIRNNEKINKLLSGM